MSKEQRELEIMLARDYKPKGEDRQTRRVNNAVHDILADATKIMRAARVIRRWGELECNGINRYQADYYGPGKGGVGASWTEEDQAKADRLTEKAQKTITDTLTNYALDFMSDDINGKRRKVKFQGDPRGWMVSFRCKHARQSWGF